MPDLLATVSLRGSRREPPIRGHLAEAPRVGMPLVLFGPEASSTIARLITSPVERVLADSDHRLFVQMRHNVYRVVLDEPIAELPPPLRVSVSADGAEVVVSSDAPTDDASDGVETTD